MSDVVLQDADELEPVLALDDIQGNVLPGFNKRYQQVVGLRITDVEGAKRWIAALLPEITSATEVQRYKELRRALKARRGDAPTGLASAWTSIAFSAPALQRLVSAEDVEAFEDEAFKVGLAARATLLGDPQPGSGERGSPSDWRIGGTEQTTADVLVVLAADRPEMLSFHRCRMDAAIEAAGRSVEVFFEQDGEDLPGALRGHEHFGFRDGISQPGVRGRLPWQPDEPLTPRLLEPGQDGSEELARPGQPLVRVGQFLFGYASQDRLQPTAPARARDAPPWAANGSFLVFRLLDQDVAGFRAFVAETTATLRTRPGLERLTEEHFAALLVGRWPSGAPVMRTGTVDDPELSKAAIAPNAFQFADPSPAFALQPGNEDPFPPAPADPRGERCPIWAHIRKVNPRDITTEQGSDTDTLRRRILRRGIPFGPQFAPGEAAVPRGLVFLSYQTSITDQFEFLASSWMNTPSKPQLDEADGHDMLVGQNGDDDDQRVRTATLRTRVGDRPTTHRFTTGTGRQWIFASGGGYFFTPSLSTLADVIAAPAPAVPPDA